MCDVLQICSKCFTESGSYKRHLRVHTGEKRYRCRSCGRAFSERASMVRHERNVCMLTTSQDNNLDPAHEDRDLETVTEDSISPYSLKDFFRSFVGKSSDALNNNIGSGGEEEGSNDTSNYNARDQQHKGKHNEQKGAGKQEPAESSPLVGEEDGSTYIQKESSTTSSESDRPSSKEDTVESNTAERICNIPPKMLQLQRLLEVRGAEVVLQGVPSCPL